ncbi:MAG: sulfatase [Anaerolineales bacterium]|nr:sulfatase [Anaerolineales bacterium]MCX7753926.1 sulfatase [Anaerolineales bacterium]MDW8278005.1 sulfatase [Anaerolineales bacterium]
MTDKRWLIPIFLLLALMAAGLPFSLASWQQAQNRPNLLFIYTDDLDMPLMAYMPLTNRLIAEQGAVFTNFFVTSSMCCPSRASTLRGQYPHNTGILENAPGFKKFYRQGSEQETLATWLERAGYQNALLGKYLNLYPLGAFPEYIPPAWHDWRVFIDEGKPYYFAYALNENGQVIRYYKKPEDYSTDVLNRHAQAFIRQRAAAGQPFFLFLSVYAPHGPSTPAPRHADQYTEVQYPKKPSFHEKDVSDKPAVIQTLRATGGLFEAEEADALFVLRVQSMQAVDEMVGDLVNLLQETGQLENTYIFFSSDNGFHMGEHMLPSGKMLPYEEDILVPLYVRGPGIRPGTKISELTVNVDLAPTFLELAGARFPRLLDGRSLAPLLFSATPPADWRKAVLIETGEIEKETDALAWRGVRTETFKYVEYENGELEFYDLVNDPFEMENLAAHLSPETLNTLHRWLARLAACRAEECRRLEQEIPTVQYASSP